MKMLPNPGLHHFLREDAVSGERARIHLRVDDGGTGTLIVNASRILHLNRTAADMAFLYLTGVTAPEAAAQLSARYAVPKSRVERDFNAFGEQVSALVRPDGACPIHELGLDTIPPFSERPSAPYRMDLAVTYRCNNDCAHCYNARPRSHPELETAAWIRVLDRLWSLGVPHVVFTGGEATLRDDLPELVAHAESNGQITGLNTNARRLADKGYVDDLLRAGLDHVQITFESSDPEVHDLMMRRSGAFRQTLQGLKNALGTRLFVMTNTTMLRTNVSTLPATLDFLADLGVPTIGLNALIYSGGGLTVGTGLRETELEPILEMAMEKVITHGQRLIWYTPTQYCNFDPSRSGLGAKGCTAALYSMCIESDGMVLPCQSFYQPVGDFLRDPWEAIWNHETCVRLRERQQLPAKCNGCPIVAECGAGCPLRFEVPSTAAEREVA